MRILFGICSWGLGHATRTLPIIRKIIDEGYEVTVVSSGRSLSMLKKELGPGPNFAWLDDYQPAETLNPSFLVPSTLFRFPRYVTAMLRERDFVRRLLVRRKMDVIFSDNRFGFYSRDVPSFFMSHQLRILNPLGTKVLEDGTEIYNNYFFKRYAGVLVPDFEEDGLAGRLAHGLSIIDEKRLNYIGVLSEFSYHSTVQDVDIFVSISGPEPQRSAFESLVRKQLYAFEGRVVVSLGKPDDGQMDNGHIEPNVKSYLGRAEREDLLNRSKIVIARSGYSTLMDLCSLRKRGFLIPTSGQPEQEYLAKHHMERRNFYSVQEKELDLKSQLEEALSFRSPELKYPTDRAVEKAVDVITGTARNA